MERPKIQRSKSVNSQEDSDDEQLSINSQMKIDQIGSKVKTPNFVYLLTFFSALGGFLFGYDTGIISGAILLLREEFLLTSVWQELVVSVTIGSAAVFAVLGGYLNSSLGRKPIILISSVMFILGSVIMAAATDKYLLLTGRIVVGAGIGFTSTTVPMYVAEVSPASIRGRLVSSNVVLIAGGQFAANVVAGIFSFDKQNGWRYMLGLAGIPAAIQLVSFFFMPESPQWLISRGNEERARHILQRIRGTFEIDDEFDSIKGSVVDADKERQDRSHAPIIIQMLRTPSVRRALIVGCTLQAVQQFAGINTVMYYSATIIKMSGVRDDKVAIWLSSVTAAVNFIFTFIGLYLVEKIGRRHLTLGSLCGAVVSLIWLAMGFQMAAANSPKIDIVEKISSPCTQYSTCNSCMQSLDCGYCYIDQLDGPANGSCLPRGFQNPLTASVGRCNHMSMKPNMSWAYDYCPTDYAWMCVLALALYLIFFAPGMGPMPWTINSEIYPLWARSTGVSLATSTNWICNLIVSMTFLSLTEAITRFGTFWLYAGVTLLGLVFLGVVLPETKGRSLEEVEGLFAHSWCGTSGPPIVDDEKTVQYVHIRGINSNDRESDADSGDGD